MSSDLGDLLEAAIATHLENTHTSIPGQVVSVNDGLVNVKPLLNRRLRDGTVEEMPVVPNVPVWFPRGGGASITWPIAAGDGCLLVFSERSLDEWKGSGGVVAPDDPRRHGLSDAIAFVGLNPTAGGSDAIELKMGDTTLTVSDEGVTINGDVTITGAVTTTGDMDITGAVTTTGDMDITGAVGISGSGVTHNGVNIGDDHVHSGVEPGPGLTGVPE